MVIVELRDESTRRASSLYDLLYHLDEETRLAMNRTLRNEKERDYSYFLMDMMNCLMNKKMSFQWFIKY